MAGFFSLTGRYRILHLTWFAFFLTFFVWFNFAPFSTAVATELSLNSSQIRAIAFCNVALTVPARIIVGMVLDRFGPRITYSCLLTYSAVPCVAFAISQNFAQLVLSRLALSIVGCGFVIGIRMVAEWFKEEEIGLAEGVYGGWGNFGSAAAAFSLPTIATFLAVSQAEVINWRFAIAGTGIVAAIYGIFYFFNVQDTPPGKVYQRPESSQGMEVTTQRDFWFLLTMNIPLVCVLGIMAWRLSGVGLYGLPTLLAIQAFLAGLYIFQAANIFAANKGLMAGRKQYSAGDRYQFSQVALLELAYVASFGSELAVVSMLPSYFQTTFGLSAAVAGIAASTYAFMNLLARPGGGLISDRIGSRKWTLATTLAGMGVGYILFSTLGTAIALPYVVIMTMVVSFFVMATSGATYAIVPLVKPRITGQVAGNVGAYGSVGGVAFLTIYSFFPEGIIGDRMFFQMLGGVALIVASLIAFMLKEPSRESGKH